VEGRYLLDLRTKINDLEQKLIQSINELEKANDEIKITKEKLVGREKSLLELTERRSSAKKTLDKVQEEKLHTDIEVTKLKSKESELEKNLTEAVAKITTLESQLNFTSEKASEIEQKINFKEKEVQNLKNDLKRKDIELESLKSNLEAKNNKNNELINRINSLEIQFLEAKTSPRIMIKIREVLEHKGFITDKELEQLIKDLED